MRATRHFGRALWKRLTGYHARSRVEAKMRCLKAFGERIASRDPDRQAAEIHTRIALMNRFSALGRAKVVRVACTQGERGNSAFNPSYATTPLRGKCEFGRAIGRRLADWISSVSRSTGLKRQRRVGGAHLRRDHEPCRPATEGSRPRARAG